MIYFDNAATGGFKPHAVVDATTTAVKYLSANPGRSGHRLSVVGAKAVYDCRVMLSGLFNCSPERVIFTKNCTEALNLAILGSAKRGGHVITTTFEHNSVLRPLNHLKALSQISFDVVEPKKDVSLAQEIESRIRKDTYMVVCTAVSNVTGQALPLMEIGKVCKERGLLFVVDGAQGAGHIPIDMKELNVNALALAGHKGLYGIMGSGALLIDDSTSISPIIYGGTGTESYSPYQPQEYPERLEAGTLNLPAVMALLEGARFVKNNLISFGTHLLSGTSRLIDGLKNIEQVTLYSSPNKSGIVAFSLDGFSSTEVADLLNHEYDVAVRGGAHCAPLTHKFLGTSEQGLVRCSLAVQNSFREIDYFIKAIKQIASKV